MRKLTLVVDVDQPTANWIWESHKKNKSINGVNVLSISEGDKTRSSMDEPGFSDSDEEWQFKRE